MKITTDTVPESDAMSAAEAYEASEDVPANPSDSPTIGDVVNARFHRRDVLRGALGVTAIAALASSSFALLAGSREALANGPSVSFPEISHGADEHHHVAEGYDADILMRWGDPVLPGAPNFDPARLTADDQEKLYGYNNDFVGYVPLPFGSDNPDHGLLCVNHEYTDEELMFPGFGKYSAETDKATREITEIEMAAHGGSIFEIRRDSENGKWRVVRNSPYARRITARSTPMRITGPAAGHDRLRTSEDPTGTRVIGTVNNCAGGITPWGTWLMAEENFHGYFWGDLKKHPAAEAGETNAAAGGELRFSDHPESRNYARYGVPSNRYAWGKFHKRWNVHAEPNEPNRFGWIVEVDPLDPTSTPRKLTALGRFKHEGAETVINPDGRIVVYSGDDQRFDYLYKFVSHGRFNPYDRQANMRLLDSGTLFVAKFDADGSVDWMPMVFGTGGLTPENGFRSQADVLIETRRAADILDATPMDRPEDVQPNKKTGKVYVMLTNNSKRKPDQVDAANARAKNIWGQIVEIEAPDGDHAALKSAWNILVQCGNPADPKTGAKWNEATTENGWFACPDNAAADGHGRLWVSTDQGTNWAKASGTADGLWSVETEGPLRGTGRMFYRAPIGAELCGPCFTGDDRTLFLAVQHPATDGTRDYKPFGRVSTFEDPATRWPDFDPKMPARPSLVAITKQDGGVIGS